ncbi:MAG: hypothetical protein E7310_07820 [Clostridiales bacterium]|nr:hypothetical protein [Clostridiales bacterium]
MEKRKSNNGLKKFAWTLFTICMFVSLIVPVVVVEGFPDDAQCSYTETTVSISSKKGGYKTINIYFEEEGKERIVRETLFVEPNTEKTLYLNEISEHTKNGEKITDLINATDGDRYLIWWIGMGFLIFCSMCFVAYVED